MEAAGTGNLLLSLEHVRRHDLTFDDELGLAGGSDHLFTKQLRRRGGAIYWCDEAVVHEFVPRDRLGRSLDPAAGVPIGVHQRPRRPDARRVGSERAAAGSACTIWAAASLGSSPAPRTSGSDCSHVTPTGKGRGAWMLARGGGLVGASAGHRYSEYRRNEPDAE